MRIINPIGGIILLFVLLGTLGCSEDSFHKRFFFISRTYVFEHQAWNK